jgi:hypothetical protein
MSTVTRLPFHFKISYAFGSRSAINRATLAASAFSHSAEPGALANRKGKK